MSYVIIEVAEVVFNRCAVSNGDEVNKDDSNYTITFNYEFLEDFAEKRPNDGRGTILSRAFTRFVRYPRRSLCSYIPSPPLPSSPPLTLPLPLLIRRNRPDINDARSEISGTDNQTESLIGDDTDDPVAASNKASHGFATRWGPKGYSKSNHCLHILVR